MAVEQTQVLPAPVLEGALTAFTKKLQPASLMKKSISGSDFLRFGPAAESLGPVTSFPAVG